MTERALMMPLAADGLRSRVIPQRVGRLLTTVIEWRARYHERGPAGLSDRERSGRPPVLDHRQIVAETLKPPPKKLLATLEPKADPSLWPRFQSSSTHFMVLLAGSGASPSVVDDQVGRLRFASDLVAATRFSVEGGKRGLCNLTNSGDPTTWAGGSRRVFTLAGGSADAFGTVSTAEFTTGRHIAPRPRNSVIDLVRVAAEGWDPSINWNVS